MRCGLRMVKGYGRTPNVRGNCKRRIDADARVWKEPGEARRARVQGSLRSFNLKNTNNLRLLVVRSTA